MKNNIKAITDKNMYLAHEVGDDSVECRGLEAESLLAGAERAEVLGGLGHNVVTELRERQMTSL